MDKKKLRIWSLSAMAAILVLSVLEGIFYNSYTLTVANGVLNPLLLVAAAVCAYLALDEQANCAGKWQWAVIAVHTGIALSGVGQILQLCLQKAEIIRILVILCYTLASASFALCLFFKKFEKLLPGAVAVFAVAAALWGLANESAAFLEILVYAMVAIIVADREREHNRILRTIGVVLTVVCSFLSMGIFAAASWIVFLYVLVPAQKQEKKRLDFAKVTAVLCVITVLAGCLSFCLSDPIGSTGSAKESVAQMKANIDRQETALAEYKVRLTQYKAELTQKQTELANANDALLQAQEALTNAKSELQAANDDLDVVCPRSSYSGFYCTTDCLYLHKAVDAAKDVVNDQEDIVKSGENKKSSCERAISTAERNIEQTEENIKNAEEEIERLNERIIQMQSRVWAERLVFVISAATVLLFGFALCAFAKCLFTGDYGKTALLACGSMALSALLPILLGTVAVKVWNWKVLLYVLESPYVWNLSLAALFAVILTKKTGKPVKFRVLAIFASIFMALAPLASGSVAALVTYSIYALTTICIALVLVPSVFTEYNSIAKHIFFSLITFGVWPMIWVYHVTKNLNKVSGVEDRKPAREVLLCLFLPFYYTYWLLKTGENVESYGAEKGKQFKLDILCLAFAFICPLIATVLIQNKINQIVGKPQ